MAILEASGLHRFFHVGDDETQALRDVSLSVDAGEMVAVSGPSGSGKSTLMACLAGLDDPDGGWVTVGGERLSRRPEAERAAIRARRIGVLYQSHNLLEHLTVISNLVLAQRLAGRIDRQACQALLAELGIADRAGGVPSQLSGGEAVRAGIAVALANHPDVILADEPTGELDAGNRSRVVDLLAERAAHGAAVMVVTHDPFVANDCHRELCLSDGAVVS